MERITTQHMSALHVVVAFLGGLLRYSITAGYSSISVYIVIVPMPLTMVPNFLIARGYMLSTYPSIRASIHPYPPICIPTYLSTTILSSLLLCYPIHPSIFILVVNYYVYVIYIITLYIYVIYIIYYIIIIYYIYTDS